MRFPVKFNRSYWPAALIRNFPSATDPRVLCMGKVDETTFTSATSTFRFGATFKLTQKARFPLTLHEIASLQFDQRPVVLDLGASDGSTSLDLMQVIPFEKYYVTDLNIEVFYEKTNEATWFYDETGVCILKVTDKWVVYPDTGGAIFPFDRISRSQFASAPKWAGDLAHILLINPDLQMRKGTNILIEKHNILEPWPHGKVDLIIAANLLNRHYFTTSEIEQAAHNMANALEGFGRFVIIDNRSSEKATIFQVVDQKISVEKRINDGTEIESLVLNSFGATDTTVMTIRSAKQA